jgi:hypothetical protein
VVIVCAILLYRKENHMLARPKHMDIGFGQLVITGVTIIATGIIAFFASMILGSFIGGVIVVAVIVAAVLLSRKRTYTSVR